MRLNSKHLLLLLVGFVISLSGYGQFIKTTNDTLRDVRAIEAQVLAVSEVNPLGRYRTLYFANNEIKLFATKKIKEKFEPLCSIIDHNVPLNAGDTQGLIAFFERYGFRFEGEQQLSNQEDFSKYGSEFFGTNLSRSDMQFEEFTTDTFGEQRRYLIFKKN